MPNQYISHSRIKLFNGCKLQYKFHYIDKLPEIPGSPLLKGKVIHKLIELYQKHCIEKRKNTNMSYKNELMKEFRNNQYEMLGYTDKDLIQQELCEEDIQDVFGMLDSFVESCMINFNHNKNIEVERKFAVDKDFKFVEWEDPAAIFKGVMDMIFTRSGGQEVVITDYKSNQYIEPTEAIRENLQLKLYAFIAEIMYPKALRFTVRYYYIRWKKYVETSLSHIDLYDFERVIIQNHRRINEARSYGYSLGSQCNFCQYSQKCPGMKEALKYGLLKKQTDSKTNIKKKAKMYGFLKMKVDMLGAELKDYCNGKDEAIEVKGLKKQDNKTKKFIKLGDMTLGFHPIETKKVDIRGISLLINDGRDNNDETLKYASLSNTSLEKMTKNLDKELYKKAVEEGYITTKTGNKFEFLKTK